MLNLITYCVLKLVRLWWFLRDIYTYILGYRKIVKIPFAKNITWNAAFLCTINFCCDSVRWPDHWSMCKHMKVLLQCSLMVIHFSSTQESAHAAKFHHWSSPELGLLKGLPLCLLVCKHERSLPLISAIRFSFLFIGWTFTPHSPCFHAHCWLGIKLDLFNYTSALSQTLPSFEYFIISFYCLFNNYSTSARWIWDDR